MEHKFLLLTFFVLFAAFASIEARQLGRRTRHNEASLTHGDHKTEHKTRNGTVSSTRPMRTGSPMNESDSEPRREQREHREHNRHHDSHEDGNRALNGTTVEAKRREGGSRALNAPVVAKRREQGNRALNGSTVAKRGENLRDARGSSETAVNGTSRPSIREHDDNSTSSRGHHSQSEIIRKRTEVRTKESKDAKPSQKPGEKQRAIRYHIHPRESNRTSSQSAPLYPPQLEEKTGAKGTGEVVVDKKNEKSTSELTAA